MAILRSDNLSLHWHLRRGILNGVAYECGFFWGEQPLLAESLLKGNIDDSEDYWGQRSANCVTVTDDGNETFIAFLKQALKTDAPGYWEPLDPDVLVAVYPDVGFPFLPHELKEQLRRSKGFKQQRAYDWFTVVVQVDAYNFTDADTYYGDGLIQTLSVKRRDLQKFVDDLGAELMALQEQ